MTDEHRPRNGTEVEPLLSPLPPPRPVLREVPRTTTPDRALYDYANAALSVNVHLPTIYKELDAFRAALNLVPEMVEARLSDRLGDLIAAAIRREREMLRDELREHVHREVQESVPDPDEVEEAARQGAARGVAEATGPHRALVIPSPAPYEPPRSITPTKLKAVAKEALVELQKAQQGEAAVAALEGQRQGKARTREDLRKLVLQVSGGVLLALTLAAGGALYGACQKQAGIAEERAAAREVRARDTATAASMETAAPAESAAAPASVAAPHRR